MIREIDCLGVKRKFQFVKRNYVDGSTAIEILLPDEGETWATLSTNIYPRQLEEDEIAVKEHDGFENWTGSLLQQMPDVFEKTFKGLLLGFGSYRIWRIKKEIPAFQK